MIFNSNRREFRSLHIKMNWKMSRNLSQIGSAIAGFEQVCFSQTTLEKHHLTSLFSTEAKQGRKRMEWASRDHINNHLIWPVLSPSHCANKHPIEEYFCIMNQGDINSSFTQLKVKELGESRSWGEVMAKIGTKNN